MSTTQVVFGVMKTPTSMLELYTATPIGPAPIELAMNLQRKCIDLHFAVPTDSPSPTSVQNSRNWRYFKMRLSFAQLGKAIKMKSTTGQTALVVSTDMPPLIFRKTDDVEGTHEAGTTLWTEWQTWYRQTGIDRISEAARKAPTQLQKDDTIIDVGRWLTYKFVFSAATSASHSFIEFCDALNHHNVTIKDDMTIGFDSNRTEHLWNWLETPKTVLTEVSESSIPSSELHQMAAETIHLPFEIHYQLEACVSHGLLHECNIGKEFLSKLSVDPEQAVKEPGRVTRIVKLLEKVCDEKARFWNPSEVFPRLSHKVSIARKKVPSYCALIRAATVTPTTIYFMTPVLETSNSIVRRYSAYEDCFLRVKFTDEKYKGKVWSSEDDSTLEVFTRIKRTMTNGINVGGRHYEFLAFGNSQFREGGAYFFSARGGLTAQKIRESMGDFAHIKVVAKYCARIGQSFSTTRTTRNGVTIEKIPDIERNGYCFTDGVGKISPFLAQMIAQEYGLPSTTYDYPSVFQFRLGGCKGVLAVDPSLTGRTVQIRPSQEKFTTMEARPSLDIVRISQFSTAYLNLQIILVLSARGVDDNIFLKKMGHMLSDLNEAMRSEKKAMELLQKSVDYNQMTLQLASMIFDGFMDAKDPFTISCLRLWRSWTTKYLKEKGRIYIEEGAFVFGCIDESGTLKGHFNIHENMDSKRKDVSSLPEIFIQISDPSCQGKLKVVTGVCVIARNPSLHPGDVRVVNAVDVPHLRSHKKNCVVFPQTGDRDLANMCSGGDLDGDDYLVIWDQELIPEQWNHSAMDYNAPTPKLSDGPVTVDDMTSFFVTHMRHDNVGRIAVAHRYWADAQPDGVKDEKCLELAALHSLAVDYVKTGVPAHMPKHLRVSRWPDWAEVKNKSRGKIYDSNKVLGKLYRMVRRADFIPAWNLAFDQRILEAYALSDETLQAAREAKEDYDEPVRRIMAKFSIQSEFEVWTTFVQEHCDDIGDYKFAETIGEAVHALKDTHQKLCYEKAGTTDKERDWSKMGPFIAAMYTVTANEMSAAVSECRKTKWVRGQYLPVKVPTVENMPFMSFPFLFPTELGRIANRRGATRDYGQESAFAPKKLPTKKTSMNILGQDEMPEPLPDVTVGRGEVRNGNPVELSRKEESNEASNGTSPKESSELPTETIQVEGDLLGGTSLDQDEANEIRNVVKSSDHFELHTGRGGLNDRASVSDAVGMPGEGCAPAPPQPKKSRHDSFDAQSIGELPEHIVVRPSFATSLKAQDNAVGMGEADDDDNEQEEEEHVTVSIMPSGYNRLEELIAK